MGNCRNDNQDQTEQETVEFEPQSPQQSPVQVPLQAINEEVSQSIAPDSLPPFEPAQPTNFTWGNRSAEEISTTLNEIYEETVHWRKNLFKVPSGKQGKSFVAELARLFQSYADQSAMEAVALKAAMILPALVLQKPFRTSKSKDHIVCMERRMGLWCAGNFEAILEEGRAIQSRLTQYASRRDNDNDARRFAELMMKGRLREATRLLSGESGRVLPLDRDVDESTTVRDILRDKHPNGEPLKFSAIAPSEENSFHPVIFEQITGASILNASLHTDGSAGPSGMDAYAWRRLCGSFQKASTNLCEALAKIARRLSSSFVDPKPLTPLVACRLVALDKCPGVRPVGIGEVPRRIISKAILAVIRSDIREVVGSLQLCIGQRLGCEASIHALNEIYEEEATEAILLVDASNAFNRLNRKAALSNAMNLCPAIGTILVNTYRSDPCLFIEGETIMSKEGTTQGDPLAMAMYAIATIPLIRQLEIATCAEVEQVWYADDSAAGGGIEKLRKWWDRLLEMGPDYGYYANPSKTWLLVKEEAYEEAMQAFGATNIKITSSGRKYLGTTIGNEEFKEAYVRTKVEEWKAELEKLADIAASQPQAAYCALNQGLKHRWSYLSRTTENISELLQPIEETIRHKVIPAIIGKSNINDIERKLLALPARLGGLGIDILPEIADQLHVTSRAISQPLKDAIRNGKGNEDLIDAEQDKARKSVKEKSRSQQKRMAAEICDQLPSTMKKAVELAQEKGASVWLTVMPIEEHGFALHKGAFRDAMALRYGWRPQGMPSTCICGKQNDVSHALSCARGGYVIMRHNEIRDATATLLREVTSSVEVEPTLQPITGERMNHQSAKMDDNCRLDVKCRGFWSGSQDAFFDVRVFNPLASSHQSASIQAIYKAQEQEKKRAYDQRVREIEHGSFTPLVMSITGGMSSSATIFYSRLAGMISEKRSEAYSKVMNLIRCRIRFSLLRSAITAIRGSRSSNHVTLSGLNLDCIPMIIAEGRIPPAAD